MICNDINEADAGSMLKRLPEYVIEQVFNECIKQPYKHTNKNIDICVLYNLPDACYEKLLKEDILGMGHARLLALCTIKHKIKEKLVLCRPVDIVKSAFKAEMFTNLLINNNRDVFNSCINTIIIHKDGTPTQYYPLSIALYTKLVKCNWNSSVILFPYSISIDDVCEGLDHYKSTNTYMYVSNRYSYDSLRSKSIYWDICERGFSLLNYFRFPIQDCENIRYMTSVDMTLKIDLYTIEQMHTVFDELEWCCTLSFFEVCVFLDIGEREESAHGNNIQFTESFVYDEFKKRFTSRNSNWTMITGKKGSSKNERSLYRGLYFSNELKMATIVNDVLFFYFSALTINESSELEKMMSMVLGHSHPVNIIMCEFYVPENLISKCNLFSDYQFYYDTTSKRKITIFVKNEACKIFF